MEQNIKEKILEQYLQVGDAGRWTSQDICDNLRDMISLTPDEVTEYLTKKVREWNVLTTVWCGSSISIFFE